MFTTNRPPVPGCLWAADNLLVRVRRATRVPMSRTLLKHAFAASVPVGINLLDREEFLRAGADALFGSLADTLGGQSERQRLTHPQMAMSCVFWPEAGELPTARQVRQAIDSIEDAHAIGLRVMLNGVGHPARAAMVAGCWLAREGYGGDLEAERLHWLEDGADDPVAGREPRVELSAGERTLVAEWPTGRDGQPELADMAWSERDEVFPTATIDHWLGKLRTVRVYPGARGKTGPVEVPVVDGQRVSDGADIDLDVDELRRGVWIGERTLRLPNGWQVVFVSPFR